ncbi:MAG TPA: PQQ-dependent sugar dehydrogenase [Candidatus Eisenbacteria bacterium]|jgi:hypothetical protein
MRRGIASLVLILGAIPITRPGAAQGRIERATGLALQVVAQGLEQPVDLTAPGSDPRLFIVEQPGRIRVVRQGRLLERPFLDLTRKVGYGGERGLLSLAFHPHYRDNGFFYVNYTDRRGDSHVERYSVSADPDVADPAAARQVLEVHQPYVNHNGGLVRFGPDGMLYVGMGDGGGAGDPHGNAQDRGSLLGDLLRIDVDHGDPYAIPPDNPFLDRPGLRGEIWGWGLRNPWRFCFDPPTHRLYIADVGQNRWEEIDVVDARQGGLNFGWNVMEGAHCYRSPRCDPKGFVGPLVEYGHGEGCSVIGGFVYRGRQLPELVGHYFYADYCAGWIRSFRYADGRVSQHRQWQVGRVGDVLSFGEDAAGELYVLSSNGRVYRLVRARRT